MTPSTPTESHWRFSTVTGYFYQSEPSTDPNTFNYVRPLPNPPNPTQKLISHTQASSNFGLIPRAYPTDADLGPDPKTTWERFAHHVRTLNAQSADPNVRYKVLFLGRHGEGYHNVAEREYGTEEWDVS